MDEGTVNNAEEFRRRVDEFLTNVIVGAVSNAENPQFPAMTGIKPLENLHLDEKWSGLGLPSQEQE